MAWGRGKWCSFQRATIVFCSINIFVALYVLYSYTSIYMYPATNTPKAFKYTPEQVRKMEESNLIRKQLQPLELIKVIKGLKEEFLIHETVVQVPQQIKHKLADEVLETLKGVNNKNDALVQHDAVESWRRKKLKEVRDLVSREASNSTVAPEEASALAHALDVDWADFSEEIGVWIPVALNNEEHDDKPEGEEFDDEIIAGRQLPPECNTELHTDYGGDAVKWGLTHPKESAYECCMSCLNQAKNAGPNEKKCNIWVYCPSETGCYSPDIYEHKHQECWLKYAEKPKTTFKDRYSESYRKAHPNAPVIVPWMSGVVSV